MTELKTIAVIGANFGDEGKGMAVDYFCNNVRECLVIRHNGGAQAGHTVEYNSRRFVFHQLSSGSLRHADTFLAETFLPDLFKLQEEAEDFRSFAGFLPKIYADRNSHITVIDDVILNMALESSRGSARHGSCGMGINEAVLRSEAGFGLSVGRVLGMTSGELAAELSRIRREYVMPRAESLGLTSANEYGELLRNNHVLRNAAEGMLSGAEYLIPAESLRKLAESKERVVFEGAQGLLLDSENIRYAPHLTSSRTGLHNPMKICADAGIRLDMAVYVMRSYVTKHGAGPMPFECDKTALGNIDKDLTNIENRWQGRIRYGYYVSPAELAASVNGDAGSFQGEKALFITHLNETGGMIRFRGLDIPALQLPYEPAFGHSISRLYCSHTHRSDDTNEYDVK